MEIRINRRKYKLYAFDIESHNDNESIVLNQSALWAGALIDETSKVTDEDIYFYSMDEFIDRLIELSTAKRIRGKKRPVTNLCIYIYNLSFEWSFLFPSLVKRGIEYESTINGEHDMSFNSVSTKSCSSVWQVELKLHPKGGRILLRDLAKIYGGGLGNLAKSFGLETQKGEIDYRFNRRRPKEEGDLFDAWIAKHPEALENPSKTLHKAICDEIGINPYPSFKYAPTSEEKDYLFKDVRIIIEILQIMMDRKDKDFFKVISSASYAMRQMIRQGYKGYKPMLQFRKEYPNLESEESEFLRKSVAGGITYATPRWQFKDITKKVLHIDMHSAHPTSAYQNYFPHGKGTYFKGKDYPQDSIACLHVKVSYWGVKLHSIIQLINLDMIDNFEIWVWDFELPTMFKCYKGLEIEFIDGYWYKSKLLPWRKFYADCYRKRVKAKQDHDAMNVARYKLLINSSYGKLLEKPHNNIIKNIINADGIIDSVIIDKSDEHIEINAKYTYLPVGSAIPARTRVRLVETALMFGWENIAYFDTDSIFVVINDQTMDIWENKIDHRDFLGGWAIEEICDRAQFTAPKRYKTEVNGKASIKAGGINFDAYIKQREIETDTEGYEVSFDEINIISSTWKVMRAYRCEGGTLIRFQTKQMKVAKKYASVYDSNIMKEQ